MKTSCITIILLTCYFTCFSQYYYRDLVLTRQTFGQMQRLKDAGVRNVVLSSFESDNQPTEGFTGSQSINTSYTQVSTSLESAVNGASLLVSYFNTNGLLIKTIDTTDGAASVTEYLYNANNQVERILNNATSKGQATEKEEHNWQYGADGKPVKMFRVKNNNDTTYVNFVTDETGNIAEENSVRKGISLPAYFYYYDAEKKLTDIVTYNIKAKRLLPLYVFDYNDLGLINSMLTVPEGSDDYQKWYYTYNDDGLKIEEKGYNKRKQLLGTIQYSYK